MDFEQIQKLIQPADTKILLMVMDELGGRPKGLGYGTPIEEASTQNLNNLATSSICGLHQPAGAGITPGSGPAHLVLFGYDPFDYQVRRGVLAALGIDFDLKNEDMAVRGNFCTIDESGQVVDRRAGRIETTKNKELCQKLRAIDLPGVEIFIEPVKEYRVVVVFRGQGLCDDISDTDPQDVGRLPRDAQPRSSNAEQTAKLINEFLKQARGILSDRHPTGGHCRLPDVSRGEPPDRHADSRDDGRTGRQAGYAGKTLE